MKTTRIKSTVTRSPFKPFTVRLSNGATYNFKKPEELGTTRNYNTLFFFDADGGFTILDSENIVEITSK